MLPRSEIVRICALAVAAAVNVNPYERRHEFKGDGKLQVARKLWIHMVVVECGIAQAEAERLCTRNRKTIEDDLKEVEMWRGSPEIDGAIESIGCDVRSLLASAQRLRTSIPSQHERYRARALVLQGIA